MASFHCQVKSGPKGTAVDHGAYIAREGWHNKRGDLLFNGHGNLPLWTADEPKRFWKAADRYERANGTAYRELVIALPRELTVEQLRHLVERMIVELVWNKPYQYAVHAPTCSLEGEANPHLHLMYSDRVADEVERSADQMFSRYNPKEPAKGGCKKADSGRTRQQVREALVHKRNMIASLQNESLEKSGFHVRVDHRTLREQGKDREAERHLGQARINSMSTEEKATFIARRAVKQECDLERSPPTIPN